MKYVREYGIDLGSRLVWYKYKFIDLSWESKFFNKIKIKKKLFVNTTSLKLAKNCVG